MVDSSRRRLRSIISRNKQNELQRKDISHTAEYEENEENEENRWAACIKGMFKYNSHIKQYSNTILYQVFESMMNVLLEVEGFGPDRCVKKMANRGLPLRNKQPSEVHP